MKKNYDFSKGVKNPYADKLKGGYTVTVHYDFAQGDAGKNQSPKKGGSDNDRGYKQA